MVHVIARLAVATLAASALLIQPASAAEPEPGWLRLSPATGTLDVPVDSLSQAACPAGTNVQMTMTGPGIPNDKGLGLLVGNTFITALPSTPTRQLYLPIPVTLGTWFGRNVPGLVPSGTYTLTLICRAALKPMVLGAFTGKIAIAKDRTYKALGETAKAFNVMPAADPDQESVPSPTASASQPAAGGAGSPTATTTTPGSAAPSTAGTPSPGSGVPSASASGSTGDVDANAAAIPSSASDSGPALLSKLALAGVVLILGLLGLSALRSRSRPRADAEPTGARERTPSP
jgi:hypothetical protein